MISGRNILNLGYFHEHAVPKPLALLVFALLFVVAYFESILWIMPRWLSFSGFYGHSLLLLGLIISLLWRDRHHLLIARKPARLPYYGLLFFGASVWFLAWAGNLIAAQILAAYIVMVLGSSIILGHGSFRDIFPPLGLFIFALPIWHPVQPFLQDLATIVVQAMASFINVPVFVEGNVISIPRGVFEIRGGCSGVGFLLVSFSLSGYLSLSDKSNWLQGISHLLISGLLALVVNWVRILAIILVGHFGGMEQPLVKEHLTFGWLVFSVFFFPYLYFRVKSTKAIAPDITRLKQSFSYASPKSIILVLLVSFVFPFASSILSQLMNQEFIEHQSLPLKAGPFQKGIPLSNRWNPEFSSADITELVSYSRDSSPGLYAYMASYKNQRQGSEIINYANSLHSKNYRAVSKNIIQTANKIHPVATELVLKNQDGTHLIVWYFYQIGETSTASEVGAKIQQILQKIQGRGNAAITAIAADCINSDCNNARKQIVDLFSFLR